LIYIDPPYNTGNDFVYDDDFVETTDNLQNPIVSPTDPTPSHTANAAGADWYNGMLQSCLQVKACISFTVWGFDDSESWVPSTFAGEGDADLYDTSLNQKPAYTALQQTLELALPFRIDHPEWFPVRSSLLTRSDPGEIVVWEPSGPASPVRPPCCSGPFRDPKAENQSSAH